MGKPAAELPAAALSALRAAGDCPGSLDPWRREQVRIARESGATWDQIGATMGLTGQQTWERFSAPVWAAMDAAAASNRDLTEDEAMDLAVAEVKAARRLLGRDEHAAFVRSLSGDPDLATT